MFAFQFRKDIALRALLIAAVLFNVFIPISAKAENLQDRNSNSESIATIPSTDHRTGNISSFRSLNESARNNLIASYQTTNCQPTTENDLIIANGETCSLDAGEYTFNNIDVQTGGTLLLHGDTSLGQGVFLHATNLTVAGTISTDGQGYAAGMGPGAGTNNPVGGGGHGGMGGAGYTGILGGVSYGDLFTPTSLGSGGGNSTSGAGGGAIHLEISDTLTVNGDITANGGDGGWSWNAGGGGAGGSIWIEANVMNGYGQITANGGVGGANYWGERYGGGGGGRIAVEVSVASNTFSGVVTAFGGTGYQFGGAGTIYRLATDYLAIANNENNGASTPLASGNYNFSQINIKGNGKLNIIESSTLTITNSTLTGGDGTGRLEVNGTLIADSDFYINGVIIAIKNTLTGPTDITIQNNGGLELYADSPAYPSGIYSFQNVTIKATSILKLVSSDGQEDYGVTFNANNLSVETNGKISADSQGYAAGMGPGAGTNNPVGGGGHGGMGGAGYTGIPGGVSYGDLFTPTSLGSGGGNSTSGAGGGAIHLEISDTLTVNGDITANGGDGGWSWNAGGGGAGGSIWIEANVMNGYGQITANGGVGGANYWGERYGGGGGGRIAYESASNGIKRR